MKRQGVSGTIAVLTLICVFGAALLLSLTTGAGVYRHVANRVQDNITQRICLTYTVSKIRNFDQNGAIHIGDFNGQDAIYLVEDIDGISYETILYVYNGWLMELFREKDWVLGLEDGQPIIEAQSLDLSEPLKGLIKLTYTDTENYTKSIFVRIQSSQNED